MVIICNEAGWLMQYPPHIIRL